MDPDPLPFLSLFFLIANVVWIQLGLALLLLICSALVSGAEVAFFSLQLKSLEELYDTNNETEVKRVIHLLRKPKRLLLETKLPLGLLTAFCATNLPVSSYS